MDGKSSDTKQAVGTVYYVYSDETIPYSDPEKFLEAYREGLDIYGPNGISASLAGDDPELGYQLLQIKVGAFGYDVDKKKYLELADKYGPGSPEVLDAACDIADEPKPFDPFYDETELAAAMERDNIETGPAIGKITFHNLDREITYASRERLINDYTRVIKEFGGGTISAKPIIEDHELAFKLNAIEANSLGFTVDREKFLALADEYGQDSPKVSESFQECTDEWSPRFEQDLEM